jgi:DNA-binding FadR family transcriptional regulator
MGLQSPVGPRRGHLPDLSRRADSKAGHATTELRVHARMQSVAANARTDVDLTVLGRIRRFIAENHYPPTYKELCQLLGFRSKGTLAVHLRALRDLTLLEWQPGQERTFVVTDRAWVAQEVVKAWFDSQGTSVQRRFRRRCVCATVNM